MNYIARAIEPIFIKLQTEYPVVLITGSRQVGKTTMLKRLMEGTKRNYVTLDDFNARALAADPEAFFQVYKPPVLIDEVQYAPQLFSYIKIIADNKQTPGDFWLTGSQAYRRMQGVTESLAGRIAILQMHALSQSEMNGLPNEPFDLALDRLQARKSNGLDIPAVFKAIFTGGMPDVINGKRSDISIFYNNYIASYIERDVKYLSSGIDGLRFFSLIKSAAARTAQLLNVADIARDAGINEVTAKNWLSILETLGIIFYLHPYSNKLLKRTVSKPKLYFYDSGIPAQILNWGKPEIIMDSAMSGAYFENFVISEIIKSHSNAGSRPNFYYYRDKDNKEVDYIFENNGQLHCIEIKKSGIVKRDSISGFSAVKATPPYTKGMGAVICSAPALSALDKNNLLIPVSLI
jgi:predicted AAA+ superfamily ATPase